MSCVLICACDSLHLEWCSIICARDSQAKKHTVNICKHSLVASWIGNWWHFMTFGQFHFMTLHDFMFHGTIWLHLQYRGDDWPDDITIDEWHEASAVSSFPVEIECENWKLQKLWSLELQSHSTSYVDMPWRCYEELYFMQRSAFRVDFLSATLSLLSLRWRSSWTLLWPILRLGRAFSCRAWPISVTVRGCSGP